MKIFDLIRQSFCRHYWAREASYVVHTNKMKEWRVCIKCGKES